MKTRLFLATICLCTFLFVNAQEETSKVKYANITEAGLITASPQGIGLEVATVNGININKRHIIGIGFGVGMSWNKRHENQSYTPIFANYRYYFKPDNKFSPHITAAVGGIITESYGGVYSAITAGFRVKKFSFSSGISLMPMLGEEYYEYYDDYGYYRAEWSGSEWYFPFGFVIKCGFSF